MVAGTEIDLSHLAVSSPLGTGHEQGNRRHRRAFPGLGRLVLLIAGQFDFSQTIDDPTFKGFGIVRDWLPEEKTASHGFSNYSQPASGFFAIQTQGEDATELK